MRENELPLDGFYQKFKALEISKRELEENIFAYIYKNIHKYRLNYKNPEDKTDFVNSNYSRISDSIDRYRDVGSSFDAYIASTLHFLYKSKKSAEASSSIAETACWEENAREAAAEQDDRALQDPAPASLPLIQAPKARNRPERLKLLVLCLKSSPPPSDDLLSKAAAAAGISQNSLRSLLLQIKLARKKEEDALANLSCKLRSRFLKTLQAEKNCALNSNPDKKNALLAEALKRKRTLLNMRERLKKKRAAPSNRQIALVLKIPKGTVDTYVYSLRKLSAAPNTPAGLNILDVNTNSTT